MAVLPHSLEQIQEHLLIVSTSWLNVGSGSHLKYKVACFKSAVILTEEKVIKPYFLKSISLVKISLMVFKTCCDTLSDLENGLLFNCLLMFS